MTDARAERQARIFDDITAKCGGIGALGPLDIELATLAAALLAAAQERPEDLTKTADTISGLLARLPDAPPATVDDGFDLRRLSDEDLRLLAEIDARGRAADAPLWEPEASTAPEITQRERAGTQLALWLNEREERFRFGGCTDERERIHLRNEVGGLLYPLDAKSLWREIYMADAQGMIETAVRKALAAVGSDAQITPATAAERAQIEPPEIPRINDGGITRDYPPFSFNGGGKQ
jgi:hypothetical protein